MKVKILRFGHRIVRDKRITTHCCLVARAFGADGIIVCGDYDSKIEDNMRKISTNWGGKFTLAFAEDWRKECKKLADGGYEIVHLTMYGLPVDREIKKAKKEKKIAVFIGSQKVPPEIYAMAKYNIAVTNQPHSEVAALAVFLDRLFDGKEMEKKFQDAKIRIAPGNKEKFAKKLKKWHLKSFSSKE